MKIIFIGGTGRSGTSILREILDRHPDAASLPFEYRFIVDPDGIVDFYLSSAWSPYLMDRRLKRLERFLYSLSREPVHHRLLGDLILKVDPRRRFLSPRSYHGWHLSRHLPYYERHVQDLMSRLVEFSFPARWVGTESYQLKPRLYHAGSKTKEELAEILGNFVRTVISSLLESTGKSFFVEDNTWNFLFGRSLVELLPESRLIHMLRDPRDVVASFIHQSWCPPDVKQAAHWYKALMEQWFSVRHTLSVNFYHELKLETLVETPEMALKGVCDFAKIPFDDALLQVGFSRSHRGRWKKDLAPQEQIIVQEILGDCIRKLGYENPDRRTR